MEQKYLLGAFALFVIALLGLGFVSAFPFMDGFMKTDLTEEEIEANKNAINTAIESGDFESWKLLMEEQIAKMQEKITEENFQILVDRNQQMQELREAMDEARESGDWTEVEALREEIGIEKRNPKFGEGEMKNKDFGGCKNYFE